MLNGWAVDEIRKCGHTEGNVRKESKDTRWRIITMQMTLCHAVRRSVRTVWKTSVETAWLIRLTIRTAAAVGRKLNSGLSRQIRSLPNLDSSETQTVYPLTLTRMPHEHQIRWPYRFNAFGQIERKSANKVCKHRPTFALDLSKQTHRRRLPLNLRRG